MGREVKIGIKVEADIDQAAAKMEGFGKHAKKLGETMSKTGAVMNIASGAVGGFGGAGAQAAAQITGLIGSVAAGGPLAAGLAAVTGLTLGLKAAYEAYTFDTELAKKETEQFTQTLNTKLDSATEASAAKVAALADRLASIKEAMTPGAEFADKQARLENLRFAQTKEADAAVRAMNAVKIVSLEREINAESRLTTAIGLQKLKAIDAAQAEKKLADNLAANEAAAVMYFNASKNRWVEEKLIRDERNNSIKRGLDDWMAKEQEASTKIAGISSNLDETIKKHLDEVATYRANMEVKKSNENEEAADKQMQTDAQVAGAAINIASDLATTLTAKHKQMTAAEKRDATTQILIRQGTALAGAIAAGAAVAWPANLAAIASGVAAVVTGFAQIASFADGGFVRGGVSGRDSVGARVMPGEYIMSRGEVSAFSTMLRRFDAGPQATAALTPSVTGAGASRGPAGGGPQIVINNRTEVKSWRPDRVEMARMTREQNSVVRDLQARGMLPGWSR